MAVKARELSWSLSKARMFDECPRRYYYYYYLAQIGFAADAPDEARLALEMKPIQSLDMWVGDVVHQSIQWIFEQARDGVPITQDEAKADVRRRLSEGWQGSAKQLWRTNPEDSHPNLFDHYYDAEVGQPTIDRIKEKAFLSVENFVGSDVFAEISKVPCDRWLPIEKYASFRIDGLLMYVKFDFAVNNGGRLTVYDWKTGKPSQDENRQLACYALYASERWDVPIGSTKVCAVHLQPVVDAEPRSVTQDHIDEMRHHVMQSFSHMTKSLRNPARNIAVMDDFTMTENMMRCLKCSFKGICDQGKSASGEIEDMDGIEEQ